MGLLDRVFRREPVPAPPLDPARLSTLWRHAARMPDPYDDDVYAMTDHHLLAQLGPYLDQFVDEYRAAYRALDTPDHARQVRPYPWTGPGQPFAQRRFGLACERAIGRGEAFFLQVLRDPSQLALVDTGPEPTAVDIVGDVLPEPVLNEVVNAAQLAGLTRRTEGLSVTGYPRPGTDWPDVPRHYSWDDHDPECAGVGAYVHPARDDLQDLEVPLTPEQHADLRLARSVAADLGDALSAAELVTNPDLGEAVAGLWDSLGRPSRVEGHRQPYELTTCIQLDRTWGRPRGGPNEVSVAVHTEQLLSLPRRVDALAAVVAHSWLTVLSRGAPVRETVTRLRDQYADALPAEARSSLGID